MNSGAIRLHAALVGLAVLLIGCSGNYAQTEDPRAPKAGPKDERPVDPGDTIFADSGFTIGGLGSGSGAQQSGPTTVVNKYLWQGALDTLSFLPLDSTDPFTGVIATDWSAPPENPRERLKVTVYLLRPALEASSLKVAVFREVRNDEGLWVPQAVSPETAAKLETAILTRARQLRIAALESGGTG